MRAALRRRADSARVLQPQGGVHDAVDGRLDRLVVGDRPYLGSRSSPAAAHVLLAMSEPWTVALDVCRSILSPANIKPDWTVEFAPPVRAIPAR